MDQRRDNKDEPAPTSLIIRPFESSRTQRGASGALRRIELGRCSVWADC